MRRCRRRSPPRAQARLLSRAIAPFPVVDEAGKPFDLPFLGGLDVPRPQFADIDADGDHDLFLQEFRNDIWFFENTGSAKAPKYEWRTDRYQNLDVGEWCRFVDLDADGDLDLLAEQPFSNILLLSQRRARSRRRGSRPAARSSTPTARTSISIARTFRPSSIIDCDGRLDLFIGRVEGLVIHYEAEAPGSLKFAFLTDHWENIEIIGRGGSGLGRRRGTARTRCRSRTSTATRSGPVLGRFLRAGRAADSEHRRHVQHAVVSGRAGARCRSRTRGRAATTRRCRSISTSTAIWISSWASSAARTIR